MTLVIESGGGFLKLLIALIFHQFFEGFALGARLGELLKVKSRAKVLPWILAFIFILTTPIGTAIGIIYQRTHSGVSSNMLVVEGVLDAICAGILIYMAFVGLIPPNSQTMHTSASEVCL